MDTTMLPQMVLILTLENEAEYQYKEFPIDNFKSCDLFLRLIFTAVKLLYNVVLVSGVQQSESAIHIHMFPHFWISFPFRSPQSTE